MAAKLKVSPRKGWILICREEDRNGKPTDVWYPAWLDLFETKKSALGFARENKWPSPYRAIRAEVRPV